MLVANKVLLVNPKIFRLEVLGWFVVVYTSYGKCEKTLKSIIILKITCALHRTIAHYPKCIQTKRASRAGRSFENQS